MTLRRERRRRALSLTSLIDVIFLLLLFFMLSTSFSQYGELPLAQAGNGASNSENKQPLVVEIEPNIIRINREPVSATDLVEAVNTQLTEATPVLLAPMAGVKTAELISVFQMLRPLENVQLAIVTEPDDEPRP